jgi:hypothetical protein
MFFYQPLKINILFSPTKEMWLDIYIILNKRKKFGKKIGVF